MDEDNISMPNCHMLWLSQNQPIVNIIEYADTLESQQSLSYIHTLQGDNAKPKGRAWYC